MERWARELVTRLPALNRERYLPAFPPAAMGGAAGQVWEQLALPHTARKAGNPFIVNPANLAPLGFGGNVVVIHDAAAIREPDWYSAPYARWQRYVLPKIAARARRIIAPSRFSRDEIVELLGAPIEKVSVIPGGVDDRFSPQADARAAALALSLDRPYVLTVASRTSRKNLASLAPAARALDADGFDLVAAGGERTGLRDKALGGGVRLLGPVPEALLPGLYAGAAAFVLPSLHEGFGLTALEAMKSGVPVVVSRAGALPEVCGDFASYVDPNDPAAIADALLRAVDRSPEPGAAEHVAQFGWARTAASVDDVVGALLDA